MIRIITYCLKWCKKLFPTYSLIVIFIKLMDYNIHYNKSMSTLQLEGDIIIGTIKFSILPRKNYSYQNS